MLVDIYEWFIGTKYQPLSHLGILNLDILYIPNFCLDVGSFSIKRSVLILVSRLRDRFFLTVSIVIFIIIYSEVPCPLDVFRPWNVTNTRFWTSIFGQTSSFDHYQQISNNESM